MAEQLQPPAVRALVGVEARTVVVRARLADEGFLRGTRHVEHRVGAAARGGRWAGLGFVGWDGIGWAGMV